ncbi:hypothetical protein NDA18_004602 [Ustilago nuda]|nr:hypothetical protein NDA18_004602 [Ustilago nuda]
MSFTSTWTFSSSSLRILRTRVVLLVLPGLVALLYLTHAYYNCDLSTHRVGWRSATFEQTSNQAQAPGNRRTRPSAQDLQQQSKERQACWTHWFSTGTVCQGPPKHWSSQYELDMIWTWNNATLATTAESTGTENSSVKASNEPSQERSSHVISKDFLRYSLRSAQKHLRNGFGSVTLLTPDDPTPHEGCPHIYQDQQKLTYNGQRPCWLITADPVYEPPQLLHHRDVVCSSSNVNKDECSEQLLTATNPSITPYLAAQTTDLSDVRLLVSPHHVFSSDVSASDFWSPLYGPTFRLQSFTVVPEGDYNATDLNGAAAARASALLNKRFGGRPRRLLLDLPQPLSHSLFKELQTTWPKQLALPSLTASNNSLDLPFLLAHYTAERYREALLWSFMIAKHDRDGNGVFSVTEAEALLKDLGASKVNNFVFPMARAPVRDSRSSAALSETLSGAHLPMRYGQEALQTSMDGSAFFTPRSPSKSSTGLGAAADNGADALQNDANDEDRTVPSCTLARQCLLPLFDIVETSGAQTKSPRTTDMFAQIAYQAPACGDCMIMHLVGTSGDRGLSSFLPSPDLEMAPIEKLPLTPTFDGVDFSLRHLANSETPSVKRIDAVSSLLSLYAHNIVIQESVVTPSLLSRLDAKISLTALELSNTSFMMSFKQHGQPSALSQAQTSEALASNTLSQAAQARIQDEAPWIWVLYVRAWLSMRFPLPMRFEKHSTEL